MDTEILSEIEKYIEEMGNLIHISESLSDLVIPKSENLLHSIYSTKIRDLKGVRRSLMMLRRDFIADGEFSQRCMDRNAEISKRRKKIEKKYQYIEDYMDIRIESFYKI